MFTDINGQKYLKINFGLQSLEPDTTPYKQRKPVFVPFTDLLVCVEVPFDNKHIANYDVWAEWLLSSSGEMPMVILTTIGFEYVASKLAYSVQPATAEPTEAWDDFNDDDEVDVVAYEKVSASTEQKAQATSWDEFEEDVDEPATPSHDEKPTDFDTEWES